MGNFNNRVPDHTYSNNRNMFLYDLKTGKRRLAKPGDMIQIHRGGYEHWVVCIGNRKVIQVTVDGNILLQLFLIFITLGQQTAAAKITKELYKNVIGNGQARINNFKDPEWTVFRPEEIVKRAHRSLGNKGYHVLSNNCEHFATYCRYGKRLSGQEEAFWSTATFGKYKRK